MGRPRKMRKQSVSLFPFLDILACVIGNLILIISTVVLEQVDTKPVAQAARIDGLAEDVQQEEANAANIQKQISALEKRSGATAEKLQAARAKIALAKQRLGDAEARAKKASQPAQSPLDATAEFSKLDATRKQLEAEIKALEREIAERQRPPEQMIAILPSGERGGPRSGVFVEAAKDGLIVHDGKTPWKVPLGKIPSDPQFKQLLEKVKQDPNLIMTFLVRSDGLSALAAGQKAAAAIGARSGRVPLPGAGELDLSGAK